MIQISLLCLFFVYLYLQITKLVSIPVFLLPALVAQYIFTVRTAARREYLLRIGSGFMYPAYSSYKAIKQTDVRQYVRWIMYWIVLAIFSTFEVVSDVFLPWLPFYYECKVVFVIWLVLPYTKGSSFLYKKFIHPNLSKREEEIDLFLENARERSYQTVVRVGSKGINLAASAVVTAAVKGQTVVTRKLRSYSASDLTRIPENEEVQRHRLSRRVTCEPIIRESFHQAEDSEVVQEPQTEADNSVLEIDPVFRTYSMLNLAAPKAMHMQQNRRMQLNFRNARGSPHDYVTDDMSVTRRRSYAEEPVPAPEYFAKAYHTMPNPKSVKKMTTNSHRVTSSDAHRHNYRRPDYGVPYQ